MSNEKHTQGRLQQGLLLDTPLTRRWTQAEREQTEIHERRMLFVGFTPIDEGRSRMRVAVCESAEDARRLVACWNACDGISTEALEKLPRPFGDLLSKPFQQKVRRGWYEIDDLAEAKAQRDELLAALEALEASFDAGTNFSELAAARAAIDKVKGGAA